MRSGAGVEDLDLLSTGTAEVWELELSNDLEVLFLSTGGSRNFSSKRSVKSEKRRTKRSARLRVGKAERSMAFSES